MKRQATTIIRMFLALCLLTGLLSVASSAPAQNTATATIPFGFVAAHHYIPAGHYRVQLLSDHTMYLQNVQTEKTQMLLIRPEYGQVVQINSRLVFFRYFGKLYLKRVFLAGTSTHSEIDFHLRPAEMTATVNTPQEATVEVAMK